jgi:hypothetical protein
MLRSRQIECGILEAEQQFKDCWSKLLTLRGDEADKTELLEVVLSFQPTLGKALFKVESLYQKVCQEGRELVARRDKLTRKGVRRRLHTLNGFKHLLKQCADVGKALGDAYAWCFYQDERELLRKHREQEPNPHPPTGIGGIGEIEFVTRLPKYGNYLVIAHSTTTFLRLGDVSLIDPETFRVAGIGELKTCESGTSGMDVTIILVGPNLAKENLPEITSNAGDKSKPEAKPLPPRLQERLNRQLSRIKESFKPKASDGMVGSHKAVGDFHHAKLGELYAHCSKAGWGYLKADRGLLLVGIPRDGETLYARLTAKLAAKRTFKRLRINEAARTIVDKALPDNSIRIDWVHYRARQRYVLESEMRPLFWWPLPLGVIEALLFKHFAVMTLYNPAFLIADLRSAGVEVTSNEGGAIRIWKQAGEKRFEVCGISYFLRLVQSELLSDKAIAAVIQHMVQSAEAAGFQRSATVSLDLNFLFE